MLSQSQTMTYKTILWFLVFFATFISKSIAQPSVPMTFPSSENQSIISDPISSLNNDPSRISSINPNNIAANPPSNLKKNDWWPPSEQEVTQTSPYSAEIHQQVSSPYYLSVSSPSTVLPHHRSEPWGHYGYPEYVYPSSVAPLNINNQIQGLTSKYAAIGIFIGLLTLFAIIQGSMMTAKRKEAMSDVLSSRKKRDLLQLIDIDHMTPEQQDIFNNDSKVRCIQRTICHENQLLSRDFGAGGIKLAKYLTQSVRNSLKNTSGWDRLVDDAGAAGLRGEDCNLLYRDCVVPVISKFHE